MVTKCLIISTKQSSTVIDFWGMLYYTKVLANVMAVYSGVEVVYNKILYVCVFSEIL